MAVSTKRILHLFNWSRLCRAEDLSGVSGGFRALRAE